MYGRAAKMINSISASKSTETSREHTRANRISVLLLSSVCLWTRMKRPEIGFSLLLLKPERACSGGGAGAAVRFP